MGSGHDGNRPVRNELRPVETSLVAWQSPPGQPATPSNEQGSIVQPYLIRTQRVLLLPTFPARGLLT